MHSNLRLLLSAAGATALLFGQSRGEPDVSNMRLEELLGVQVTSVSRKEQKLSRTPAAVFVITSEDIRRSTATSIPELLRMVPGLSVARIDANSWAISARGFNGRFANKMLVLVDGRSVYTPVFSGVYWDTLDMPLDEIGRIEIIRGPGSVMWGANAVNGVINIITRNSRESVGLAISGGGGNFERGFGNVRIGGELPGRGWFRAYGRTALRGSTRMPGFGDAEDGWDSERGGFRADFTSRSGDRWRVEGSAYRSFATHIAFTPSGQRFFGGGFGDRRRDGGTVAGRWERESKWGRSSVHTYYDRLNVTEERAGEQRWTAEIDLQHALPQHGRHQLQFGMTGRFTADRIRSGQLNFSILPDKRLDRLFGAYVEDEIELVRNRLIVWPGLKIELNDRTGLEPQPGVRAEWLVSRKHSVWSAWSRAVRTPSRIDRDLQYLGAGVVGFEAGLPVAIGLVGNPDFGSEVLLAHEIGWRAQVGRTWSVDVAAYVNRYSQLKSIVKGAPSVVWDSYPRIEVPNFYRNTQSATSRGIEASMTWSLHRNVRISPGYTFFDVRFQELTPEGQSSPVLYRGSDPRSQVNLRSYVDLPKGFSFDSACYRVSSIRPISGVFAVDIPRYYRVDGKITKKLPRGLEFSISGENLQGGHHQEFGPEFFGRGSTLGRSVYAALSWRTML